MSNAQYQPVSNGQGEGSDPAPPAYSHPTRNGGDAKLGQPAQEEQSSRAAVTASVLFYLVAALVVRILSSI